MVVNDVHECPPRMYNLPPPPKKKSHEGSGASGGGGGGGYGQLGTSKQYYNFDSYMLVLDMLERGQTEN